MSGSGSGSGSTGGAVCTPIPCGNKILECGNCIDDDNDGGIDLGDKECVGPCDDDESLFQTGIPGDNMDPCKQDCFFDGDSGFGNDGCDWNLKCEPEDFPQCPYDPNYNNCPTEQSQKCKDNCKVPNGCDCFGCCTIDFMGQEYDVYLGDPNCNINNVNTCQSCTINDQCSNPCDPNSCEVCFGQELPDMCTEPECPDMKVPCDANEVDPCEEGFFCLTGCCEELPK